MIIVAIAIVVAALIMSDSKPRGGGGYQPKPSRKPLGKPPTGGSAVKRRA